MPGTDFHSRLVGWLKVVLPLAALAMLSTLFLVADRIDPENAAPRAGLDVDELVRDPRMAAPSYAGTTRDGAGITLSAREARPASEGRNADATSVTARIDTPDGGHVVISAGRVDLDTKAKVATLSGGVTLTASSGYEVTTDGLTARLDRTGAESTAPVQATAPMGRIDAGGFALVQDAADPGAYLLVFNKGVKLVYQPGG